MVGRKNNADFYVLRVGQVQAFITAVRFERCTAGGERGDFSVGVYCVTAGCCGKNEKNLQISRCSEGGGAKKMEAKTMQISICIEQGVKRYEVHYVDGFEYIR